MGKGTEDGGRGQTQSHGKRKEHGIAHLKVWNFCCCCCCSSGICCCDQVDFLLLLLLLLLLLVVVVVVVIFFKENEAVDQVFCKGKHWLMDRK